MNLNGSGTSSPITLNLAGSSDTWGSIGPIRSSGSMGEGGLKRGQVFNKHGSGSSKGSAVGNGVSIGNGVSVGGGVGCFWGALRWGCGVYFSYGAFWTFEFLAGGGRLSGELVAGQCGAACAGIGVGGWVGPGDVGGAAGGVGGAAQGDRGDGE